MAFAYDITFHPSWWHRNAGIDFVQEFFDEPEYRLDCDLKMRRALYDHFGDYGIGEKNPARRPILGTDLLAAGYLYSELFGCGIRYEPDNSPQVLCAGLDEAAIEKVECPDLATSEVWARPQRQIDYLQTKYGHVEAQVNLMGIQNILLDLMGSDGLMAYYGAPEAVRTLLTKITDLSLELGRRFYALSSDVSGGVTRIVAQVAPLLGLFGTVLGFSKMLLALKASAPVVGVSTLREPGNDCGGIYALEFGEVPGDTLTVRIALSNTSPEAAERNMAAEAPTSDFDAVRARSAAAWAKRLGCIELDAGTDPKVRTSFETALYRIFVQPNRQSDVGKRAVYSTFSLWDTFRAAHPLYTILAPDEDRDFVLSMLDQYDRQGYLPIFTVGDCETHCMIASHVVPVLENWRQSGVAPEVDWKAVYAAVAKSLKHTIRGRSSMWQYDLINRYGYLPHDLVAGQSVSRTLEKCLDDVAASRTLPVVSPRIWQALRCERNVRELGCEK